MQTGVQTYSSWYVPQRHLEDKHGPHNDILPPSALPRQRSNRPGQYRYPFAEGAALHLPRVPPNVQRPQRHRLLSAAHLGRDRGAGGDLARSWVSSTSDWGGVWL